MSFGKYLSISKPWTSPSSQASVDNAEAHEGQEHWHIRRVDEVYQLEGSVGVLAVCESDGYYELKQSQQFVLEASPYTHNALQFDLV